MSATSLSFKMHYKMNNILNWSRVGNGLVAPSITRVTAIVLGEIQRETGLMAISQLNVMFALFLRNNTGVLCLNYVCRTLFFSKEIRFHLMRTYIHAKFKAVKTMKRALKKKLKVCVLLCSLRF